MVSRFPSTRSVKQLWLPRNGNIVCDISAVGEGARGSALVETLAEHDVRVTVWNRTRERAEALAGPRVSTPGGVITTDRAPLR